MSIPATEHSVMTAWRTEREAMENMIEHFGSGILACVMDSYDYVQVSCIQLALLPLHCDFAFSNAIAQLIDSVLWHSNIVML